MAVNVVESTVASPCINTCKLNSDNICQGCYRSINEIMQWIEMSDDQRRDVIQRCGERRSKTSAA